jgi:predicted MFS family arabinose efflux permease
VAGLLLEWFWWGSAVLVNLPVVAIALVAVALWAPRSRDSHATPLDPVGSVLAMVAMVALLFGIIEGAERGWTDALVLGAFVLAVAVGGGFVAWESRTAHPMLPLTLFRDRRFSVGSAAISLTFFSMFGVFFLSTLYTQYVLGYSPLEAGLASLPAAVAMILVAPRSAALAERFGPGPVIAGGFAALAASLAVFTTLGTGSAYLPVGLALGLMGVGLGFAAAPATGLLMSAVPMDKAGVGSAVNDTTREFGGALGIAVFGTIAGSAYRSGFGEAGTQSVVDAGLGSRAAESAHESIGGAWGVAQGLPGGGTEVLSRAQDAFVDAFRLANSITLVVALLAGAFVWTSLRARGTGADAADVDPADAEPILDPEAEPALAYAAEEA